MTKTGILFGTAGQSGETAAGEGFAQLGGLSYIEPSVFGTKAGGTEAFSIFNYEDAALGWGLDPVGTVFRGMRANFIILFFGKKDAYHWGEVA